MFTLALTAITSICALLAIIQLGLALRVRASVPLLSADVAVPGVWPRMSIIVPARNEASGIERALSSKLACGYENLEIVVVNDRSTDDTGAIAERLTRADERLTVIHIDELPPGWLGKVHAMAAGAARASGDWLLLSDADVHIEPGTLERVVAYAEAHAIDFVSLLPQMEPVDPILDACIASTVRTIMLGGRTWLANDDRSEIGVGVGAFNLVRARALQKSPGLAYLRMEIADDVALGAMLKASGARCRVLAAGTGVHLVLAERLSDLTRSSEKAGSLLGFSIARTLAVAGLLLAFDLAVPIASIVAGGLLSGLGALTLAVLAVTHAVLVHHLKAPMRGALLWPLGSIISIVLLARSGALAWWHGAVAWRGTRYSKSEIEAGRRWVGGRVRLHAGPAYPGLTTMKPRRPAAAAWRP
jgi:hypothetical protein